ncbi:hypothetical protein FRB96_002336 [Tulasnella sp. 330]|nr:hypothetical protein FRB96_002336 [Tulasnella sp. 330]
MPTSMLICIILRFQDLVGHVVDPSAHNDRIAYFHNVELQSSNDILVHYYYARVAWTILRPRLDFMRPQSLLRDLQVQDFGGKGYQIQPANTLLKPKRSDGDSIGKSLSDEPNLCISPQADLDSIGKSLSDEPNLCISPQADLDCPNDPFPGISVEHEWPYSSEWNPYYPEVTRVEKWKAKLC